MSFKRMIKRMKHPDEEIHLEQVSTGIKDSVGNSIETWVNAMDLDGVIQERDFDEHSSRGHEEMGSHIGFFTPDFEIPYADSPDFRIRHVIPRSKDRYYKIVWIDRNLFLRGKRHHYEMGLELSRKWYLKG